MLNEATLKELSDIMIEEYGIALDPQELRDLADVLVRFFEQLAKYDARDHAIKT